MGKLKYVGLDVHKETITISILSGRKKTPDLETTILNREASIKRFFKKQMAESRIQACYEAGCTGFALKRYLAKLGIECIIAAPGKIPRRAGNKVKTDRRDARELARLLRNGDLEDIFMPSEQYESARDYLRAREDYCKDMQKNKQRLLSFLLRNGLSYSDGGNWTQKHKNWLNKIAFDDPLKQMTFDKYKTSVIECEQQLSDMDENIRKIAKSEPFADKAGRLRCFKGIDYLIALSIICEIGDFRRFRTAKAFMAYLGLIPSEYSSGAKKKRGSITKTGNSHLRKLLTEASWHYKFFGPVGKSLSERRKGQPSEIILHADKARRRLYKKFHSLTGRGKAPQVAIIAVERELAGFIWGVMAGDAA